ncbi:MAG: hypothetical protein COA58_00950 [Bacteroidetes bacterium]|nr:MAG: hypothetical protein COA58_00950 [Bacteroidota bacterium]
MMKQKLNILLLLLFITTGINSLAQEAELQDKYWNYRHRLRTEFTKIGKGAGHSIPAENRDINKVCGNVPGKYQSGDATLNLGEYIAVLATEYKLLKDDNRDVTATANELYYALNAVQRLDLFAEEFFIPGSTGNPDGFFVRDDWPGDMYRKINTNEVDTNGQLIADPITNYFALNGGLYHFQMANREEGPVPSNDYLTEGVVKTKNLVHPKSADLLFEINDDKLCYFARDGEKPLEARRGAEMSQDQVYGLLMGFYAVKKFVPSDAAVAPRPSKDKYINFHAWVEVMTDRILTFVSKQKTVNDATILLNEDDDYRIITISKLTTTWFINNPNNDNKQVMRGMNMWIYAEPLARIGKEITGKTYNTDIVVHLPKAVDRAKVLWNSSFIGIMDNGCTAVQAQTAEKHNVDGTEYKTVEKRRDCIKGASAAFAGQQVVPLQTILFPIKLWMAATGDIKLPSSKNLWKIALWSAASSKNTLGSQMTIKIAAMDPAFNASSLDQPLSIKARLKNYVASQISNPSATITANYYNQFTNLFENHLSGKEYYNLLPNAYHPGHSTIISKSNQLKFLNSIPCEGTGKTSKNSHDYTIDNMWMHADMLSLSKQSHPRDSLPREETVAMSFMLFYNLYRLVYQDDFTDSYKENSCPCVSSALIKHTGFHPVTGKYEAYEFDVKKKITSVNTVQITPRRFSEYADIGIPKPFYLSHNVAINDNGLLRVSGDLTLCGSELKVKKGGELFIPNTDPNYPTEMLVDNGGYLKLDPGATLRIGNNSTLRIGSAGKFRVGRNLNIVLDGPNANLIIEGELILMDNAAFRIWPGPNGLGYVTFKKGKNALNGDETFAKITTGRNSSIYLQGTSPYQKILEIDGSFGVIIPETLAAFEVRNGKIELGEMSRLHVSCPITLRDCRINTINNADDYYYFAGLITTGQRDVNILNCKFKQGLYGLLAHNYVFPHNKPNLENCQFDKMITPIAIRGGGVDLYKVSIKNSSFSIDAHGINELCILNDLKVKGGKQTLFSGSSSGILDWDNGYVKESNAHGITLIGNTLKTRCVHINDNARHGIYARKLSHISLSTNSNDGYNSITNNTAGIYNSDYNGLLYGLGIAEGISLDLVNGFNDISGNGLQLDIAIKPSQPLFNGSSHYYIESSNNYWGTPTPSSGIDYKIYHKPIYSGSFSYAELGLPGSAITDPIQLLTKMSGVCGFPTGITIDGDGNIGRNYGDELSGVFIDGLFVGRLVNQVLFEADEELYKLKDYASARDKYKEVFMFDFNSNNENAQTMKLHAYKNYYVAQEYLRATDSLNMLDDNKLFDETIVAINTVITQHDAETPLSSEFVFNLKMDKADMYRKKDDRMTAILEYDQLLSEPEYIESYDLIEYFKCIVTAEMRILNGDISIHEQAEHYVCKPPIDELNLIITNTVSQDSSSNDDDIEGLPTYELVLHPNPTQGMFTVELDENAKTKFNGLTGRISVADGYGYEHIVQDNISADAMSTFNLHGYKAGVYNVRFEIGGSIFYKYVVKTDE